MTSTLSNFPATSAAPTAPFGFNFAAMTGSVPVTGTAPATPAGTDGGVLNFASFLPSAPATAFATFLPNAPATVPASALPIVATASPDAATVNPAVSDPPTCSLTLPIEEGEAPAEATLAPVVAFGARGQAVSGKVSMISFVRENSPARPHGISREEFEHAAAFVAALMQALTPATPAVPAEPAKPEGSSTGSMTGESVLPVPSGSTAEPMAVPSVLAAPPATPTGFQTGESVALVAPVLSESAVDAPLVPERGSPKSPTELMLPNGRAFPTNLPPQAKPAFTHSRPADDAPSWSPPSEAAETSLMPGDDSVSTSPLSIPAGPDFPVAEEGAIELGQDFPASSLAEIEHELPTTVSDEPAMEVSAELELPGQAVVRVEASVPMPVSQPVAVTAPDRPVIFAGQPAVKKISEKRGAEPIERNFVMTGDKRVNTAMPQSGISVAKTDDTMRTIPTEEFRTPRNPEVLSGLPSRVDFQVAQSPAERISHGPAEPAVLNFAERAVATVTGLAEAQFSASMHKAGSVQLRLKFGGEDLSVRVELRDGAVHTDFRTDSPVLREAIAREWQAVAAASPNHLQRFLDPVFSPSSPSTPADAGTQYHSSHRQPQQQPAHDQPSRQDVWHSQSPFARRSSLNESFVPEPPAARVPVLLPTSLRLSALA
jgi:hypothetical protein